MYQEVLDTIKSKTDSQAWNDLVLLIDKDPYLNAWKQEKTLIENEGLTGIVRDVNMRLIDISMIIALQSPVTQLGLYSVVLEDFAGWMRHAHEGFPLLPAHGDECRRRDYFYVCRGVLEQIAFGKFNKWERCGEKYITLADIEKLKSLRRDIIKEPMFFKVVLVILFAAILVMAMMRRKS